MKNVFRILLPLVILTLCGYAAWWLYRNQPVAEFREMPPSLVRVEGTVLRKTTHQVIAHSQGTVQPRTRSTLLPEVSAKVIEIGESFRPGGFFEKDEVLVKLDPVDYETALVVSKAALAQAESMLAEEMAKAEQARENWKALGRTGEPNSMVLRVPQVAKAQADAASAKAQILKAERDLDRIKVEAEQRIAQARAEAESAKLAAEAQAVGLKAQRDAVTPELIELRKVEAQLAAIAKWDGRLPNVSGGAMPFIQVDPEAKK